MNPWQPTSPIITKQSFYDLFFNKIPHIIVENFLSSEKCSTLVKEIRNFGLRQYDYNFATGDAPPANHLFETHYLYEQKTPAEYFPKAQDSIKQYQQLCNNAGFDPVAEFQVYLSNFCEHSVTIASQNGQLYSYAIIRELNNSALLHADFANFIPEYWSINRVIAQYAWNIYLTDPGLGGECLVYNKPWEKTDDQYILKDTYGYDHCIVQNAELVSIKPAAGKLVIFNSRNFHEVKKSEHSRLSIGGHVGLTKDGDIIMWV